MTDIRDYLKYFLIMDTESLFSKERSLKYFGIARVEIKQLDFSAPTDQALRSHKRRKNKDLRKIRLLPEHYVAAIISSTLLDEELQKSNLTQAILRESLGDLQPLLKLSTPLQCLYGYHILRAATEFLTADDQWWMVELYSSGIIFIYVAPDL